MIGKVYRMYGGIVNTTLLLSPNIEKERCIVNSFWPDASFAPVSPNSPPPIISAAKLKNMVLIISPPVCSSRIASFEMEEWFYVGTQL